MNSNTRRLRVNKALEMMPVNVEFFSTDIEEIMTTQYRVSTLSTRAIGFVLSKLPNIEKLGRTNGKTKWIKRDTNGM